MTGLHHTHFWPHAALAGLIGGVSVLVAEMVAVLMIGDSPWDPPRIVVARALSGSVLPSLEQPAHLKFPIPISAMLIHALLSISYGLLIGWAVQLSTMRRTFLNTIVLGSAIGVVIYLFNFHFVASFAFEWFATQRNWVSILTHLVFGSVTAWVYITLTGKPRSRAGMP